MTKLLEAISKQAITEDAIETLSLTAVRELAAAYHRSIRGIELAALGESVVPQRYLRNIGTIGIEGQMALLEATVAIVGLGGLGGYVAEALARMGVGHLILIDGDTFDEHNLNRQLLSEEANLGAAKVEVASARVAAVNGAVTTTAHPIRIDRQNLTLLLKEAELVVDGLDRLPTRLMVEAGAQELGIPMVHGSIAGFLGQVMTIFPGDPGLRALYGAPETAPAQGMEAQLGTPAATPMAVAAWEAQEVVKVITGHGQPLRHRLLIIDFETNTTNVLELN